LSEESKAGGLPAETPPNFAEAFVVWCRIALLSFGGPAGQIAVMHRIVVEEKKWLSERRFLHALNYCMLLPGPEAQQLTIYIGWLMHRTIGGLVAGTLFVLPGFVSILGLSILYTSYQDVGLVQGVFYGLKPGVIAIVVQAVMRLGGRALATRSMVAVAGLAFVAIFFFQVPFPLIILAAAAFGLVGQRLGLPIGAVPDDAAEQANSGEEPDFGEQGEPDTDSDSEAETAVLTRKPAGWRRTLGVLVIGLLVWWLPVAAVVAVSGPESVYSQQALFFSKVAVVTFGGAYAVLAYIAQEGVDTFEWLRPGEMLDGLGMAETTPGPLIQVVQFVGFMGAYRNPGDWSPMVSGIFGSLITTWVTFAPCYLWIFLGAPHIERLHGRHGLTAALSTITAAVVGVVLNLSLWFALHTLFGVVHARSFGGDHLGGKVSIPQWSSLDPVAALITAISLLAIFRFRLGMLTTLAIAAALGLAWQTLAGG